MTKQTDFALLLQEAEEKEQGTLVVNEPSLQAALQQEEASQSLPIKILTVTGGILASLAFAGFLFITGIYDSRGVLLFFSLLSLAGVLWLDRARDKVVFDTFTVALFVLGLVFLTTGLADSFLRENGLILMVGLLSLVFFIMAHRPVLIFTAALLLHFSVLGLIFLNEQGYVLPLYLAGLCLLLTYVFLYEGRLITRSRLLLRWYRPLRASLAFALLTGMVAQANLPMRYGSFMLYLLFFLTILFCVCWVLYRLFHLLHIREIRHRTLLYALSMVLLVPGYFYPPVAVALLLLLIGFLFRYQLCFALGVVYFLYAISRFYYELHITLLLKSLLMLSSGILFLLLYFFTQKKLRTHEAV